VVSVSGDSPSEAGQSAQAHHDQLVTAWRAGWRQRHPILGPLVCALLGEPRRLGRWADGAAAEQVVAHVLAGATPEVLVLHDRRIPHSSANIDHLAIGPTGVFVVDTKRRRGTPVRVTGFGRRRTLWLGRCVGDDILASAHRQAATVTAALAGAGTRGVPVKPTLVFVDSHWRLRKPTVVAGVLVAQPDGLARIVSRPGPLSPTDVATVGRVLAARLPGATAPQPTTYYRAAVSPISPGRRRRWGRSSVG
jgi:hypothetical protein